MAIAGREAVDRALQAALTSATGRRLVGHAGGRRALARANLARRRVGQGIRLTAPAHRRAASANPRNPTVGVAMMVQNAAHLLAVRPLARSPRDVDDVVVLDGGSRDDTREVARGLGATGGGAALSRGRLRSPADPRRTGVGRRLGADPRRRRGRERGPDGAPPRSHPHPEVHGVVARAALARARRRTRRGGSTGCPTGRTIRRGSRGVHPSCATWARCTRCSAASVAGRMGRLAAHAPRPSGPRAELPRDARGEGGRPARHAGLPRERVVLPLGGPPGADRAGPGAGGRRCIARSLGSGSRRPDRGSRRAMTIRHSPQSGGQERAPEPDLCRRRQAEGGQLQHSRHAPT